MKPRIKNLGIKLSKAYLPYLQRLPLLTSGQQIIIVIISSNQTIAAQVVYSSAKYARRLVTV